MIESVLLSIRIFLVMVILKIGQFTPWTYEIKDLKGEKIIGSFYKKKNCCGINYK